MLHKLKNSSLVILASPRVILSKAKNLKSFPSVQPILLKAIAFALLFLIVEAERFNPLLVALFVLVAFIFYAKPLFKTRSLLVSFCALIILSLLIASRFAISFETAATSGAISFSAWAFAALFGLLFYLILGIKYLVFIKRKEAYYFLHLGLLYLAFTLYFAAPQLTTLSVLFQSLVMFFFLVLLLREFFTITGVARSQITAISRWVLALMTLQAAWVINLLPIEFSHAASLATLFAFIVTEITRRYFEGGLSARFVRWNFVVFLVLVGAIFLASEWTL